MPEPWSLAAYLAYLRSWLAPGDVDFGRDRPRRELEQRLAEHGPFTLAHAAGCVGSMALWEYNLGTFQVLEGDPGGWGHVRLGVECDAWRLRARLHIHTVEPDVWFRLTRDTACAMASAAALRDDPTADWCGALLAREFARPAFLTDWADSPLFGFLTWLYALWRGVTIDARGAPIRSFGVYGPVVAAWDDDAALAAALGEACEYHCARAAADEAEEEDHEFQWPPYPVFPGEVLAVLRVREELTGRRVRVDHPLMNSPLGSVPDALPRLVDPLLERFKARVLAEEASHAGRPPGGG